MRNTAPVWIVSPKQTNKPTNTALACFFLPRTLQRCVIGILAKHATPRYVNHAAYATVFYLSPEKPCVWHDPQLYCPDPRHQDRIKRARMLLGEMPVSDSRGDRGCWDTYPTTTQSGPEHRSEGRKVGKVPGLPCSLGKHSRSWAAGVPELQTASQGSCVSQEQVCL